MRTAFLAGYLLLWTSILSAQPQTSFKTISIEISNSWTKDKIDAPVVLKIEDVPAGIHVRSAIVLNGEEKIPSLFDDLNGYLQADQLAFVMNVPGYKTITLTITLSSALINMI
jgi:hypothetical protein